MGLNQLNQYKRGLTNDAVQIYHWDSINRILPTETLSMMCGVHFGMDQMNSYGGVMCEFQ